MSRGKTMVVAALVAAGALAAGLWLSHDLRPTSASDPAAIEQLLALTLKDTSGAPQSMAQWTGKIVVVNFWATWCPPCREEMPGFERLSRQYADKGVQFVGISIDTAVKVRQFAMEIGVSYPLLLGDMATFDLVRNLGDSAQALPFTIILDRSGVPRRIKLGRLDETDLSAFLDLLLKK